MAEESRAACVIGWPVSHSRSPIIHKYWLEKYGIAGDYRREAVKAEDFDVFVGALREKGYVGANVTLPHKVRALEISKPDRRAVVVGAANTLWIDDEELKSTNTDVEGFINSLDAAVPGWDKAIDKAVVLGAGGAARAVVQGLLERGAERIALVNRSQERAKALRKVFGSVVEPSRWDECTPLLSGAALLVNTTSLGMAGQPELEINLRSLPPSAVVVDLVYAPLKTELLRQAEDRGFRTADGLGMLLYQAVRGFELWFGVKPEVTPELRALVERDIAEKH
jgi:shikimate dehydrogenase